MQQQRHYVTSEAPDDYRKVHGGGFSATDIYASILLPGYGVRKLGTLAAVSLSTHRDTFPVTSLASVKVKGFTTGHRTVAGTLVFHTIDRNALTYGVNPSTVRTTIQGQAIAGKPLPDTLPLFDIHITYANEWGNLSFEALLGVRVLDFGKTMSFETLQPIESYSYMALDYQPMVAVYDPAEQTPPIFTLKKQTKSSRANRLPLTVPSLGRTTGNQDPELPLGASDLGFQDRGNPIG
jgi:hypothetical protein